MSNRLSLVLDVSVLFRTIHAKFGLTGIPRSADELFRELTALPEVEARFTAPHAGTTHLLLTKYARLFPYVREEAIVSPWRYRFGARTLAEGLLHRGLTSEAEGRLRQMFSRQVRSLVKRLVVRERAPGVHDVFHSPYHALPPREIYDASARFLTVHDLIALHSPEFFRPSARRYMQQIVDSIDLDNDWVIANSECTKRDLCAHTGVDPERVFVTYWAASPRVFHPVTDAAALRAVRQKYGIPERPYVVSLSTLEPRKNLVHLVRCFDELLDRHSDLDASLVVAGAPGWMYEPIFAAVEAARHRQRIVLPGRVADEDLSALLGGARCFVCVSLYEGFGLPALEAMQCGVPVIVSDSSALPEVVGDAGLRVPATDAAALVDAMRRLLTDEPQREQLARAGFERSRGFSWRSAARQTVEAYRAALEARQRGRVVPHAGAERAGRRTGAGT